MTPIISLASRTAPNRSQPAVSAVGAIAGCTPDWTELTLVYRFVRHARHDMANLATGLALMDLIEMAERQEASSGPAVELPPELEPQALRLQAARSRKAMTAMASDFSLLSQATNPSAYDPPRNIGLDSLLSEAIWDRHPNHAPAGIRPSAESIKGLCTVSFGDMLASALATLCFQWTAGLRPTERIGLLALDVQTRHVDLDLAWAVEEIAADRILNCLNCPRDPDVCSVVNPLTVSTTEMAVCVARRIIERHGGQVSVVHQDGRTCVRVRIMVVARP